MRHHRKNKARLRTLRAERLQAAAVRAFRALPPDHTPADFVRAVGAAVRWTR